jgi:hypothetical protein
MTTSFAAALVLTGRPYEEEALHAFQQSAFFGSRATVRTPRAGALAATPFDLPSQSLWDTATLRRLIEWFLATNHSHLMLLLPGAPQITELGFRRWKQWADDTTAPLLYADYFERASDGALKAHPLIDYQPGSIRDDFDFGPVICLRREGLDTFLRETRSEHPLAFGALYHLRLRLAEKSSLTRIPEPLSVFPNPDLRASGQKNFDYCDPRARDYQIEMERVASSHLIRIKAAIPRGMRAPARSPKPAPVTASVIIPVRNRVKTVGDAVQSALAQQASFPFNVIVVDNHSDDGTTQLLRDLSRSHPNLVHVTPERRDLLIGGCWNEAVFSEHCGEFAVQLDSDDLYSSQDVLERIVAEFRKTDASLVIGSYTIVNVALEVLPPGLIDHKEWTFDNGANNALRIAGLGAPRAFHTATIRELGGFPNTSYGEDYGAVLRLLREHKVGRIYDSLYWCRRWEGNSDSALPLETSNRYSSYKDKLRTLEIEARQRLNLTR